MVRDHERMSEQKLTRNIAARFAAWYESCSEEARMNHRDVMAPDTDPTDEELEIVAKEALHIAMERQAKYDNWVSMTLEQAATEADKNRLSPSPDKNEGK